jgi:hypothetical protein
VENSAVSDKRGVILELGPDVRNVEGSIDFQNYVGPIGDLEAHVMISASDVSGAAGIAVAGCHGHSALGICLDWDSEGGIGVESVHFLKDLSGMLASRDAKGSDLVFRLGRRESNRVRYKRCAIDETTLAKY